MIESVCQSSMVGVHPSSMAFTSQEGEVESPTAADRAHKSLEVLLDVAVSTPAANETETSTDVSSEKIELVFRKAPLPVCEEERVDNLKRVFDLSAMAVSPVPKLAGRQMFCTEGHILKGLNICTMPLPWVVKPFHQSAGTGGQTVCTSCFAFD